MSLNLIRQLNALALEADSIPCLNWGGCCVFAAAVAEKLHGYGIPVWGIVSGYGEDLDLNVIRLNEKPANTVGAWNDTGITFRHVLIQFPLDGQVWTFDSNGCVLNIGRRESTCNGELYRGNLTVTELRELADDADGWCPSYSRRNNTRIKQLVDQYLSLEAITYET